MFGVDPLITVPTLLLLRGEVIPFVRKCRRCGTRFWTENYAGPVWEADVTSAVDVNWCDDSAKKVEIGQKSLFGQSGYPQDLRPREASNEVGKWYSVNDKIGANPFRRVSDDAS